jgi:YbbR domain-containing protein
MYAVVNYDSMASVYTSTLKYSKTIEDVQVTAQYNTDTFELSGLPASANVTITGDATNVTNAAGITDAVVVADLDGMTEGEHTVKLKTDGYGSNVTTVVNPSTAVITLKKKTTQQFDISYDFHQSMIRWMISTVQVHRSLNTQRSMSELPRRHCHPLPLSRH